MIWWILSVGAVVLIGLLIAVRASARDMGSRLQKIALLVVMGILPPLWLLGMSVHAMDSMKKVEFCLQCHEMVPYGRSLKVDDEEALAARHYQNNYIPRKEACYDCHTSYAMFGGIRAKLTGLLHVYVHYLGEPPEELHLYRPYSNGDCLRCHGEAKNFVEVHDDEELMKNLKTNQETCLAEGCHDTWHVLEKEAK